MNDRIRQEKTKAIHYVDYRPLSFFESQFTEIQIHLNSCTPLQRVSLEFVNIIILTLETQKKTNKKTKEIFKILR